MNRVRLCGLVALWLALLGVWGSGEVRSSGKGEQVFVVLIGVNKYRSREITPLQYTDRDVRALYSVLTGPGGIPRANVRMLLNEKATGRAIRSALKVWLRKKVKRGGKEAKVVVYFSGHGYAQGGTSYWLPYDANIRNAEMIERTGISSDHFNDWLSKRRMGSRSVVVFVDACNSGFAWSGSKDAAAGQRKKNLRKGFKSVLSGQAFGEGHTVIASSMQDQFSVEVAALQHGVFSYALVEALQGKADFDRDGVVTLPEVWMYLSSRVRKLAMQYKRYPQTPVKSGAEAGSIALSYPKTTGGSSEQTPLPTPQPAATQGEGVLVVSANVGGVKVYVDGRYRAYLRQGQSKRLKMPSGKHTVSFQKNGYAEKKEDVELESGGELPLEGVLAKQEQAVVVERPPVVVVERPAERPTVGSAQSTQGRTPSAGSRKTFTARGATFAMRWIPAGSFTMGSPSTEPNHESDEGPQRRVRISKGFWMLESEVTQGQYKALMGSNPSHFDECGNNCPVEKVSWDDARAFANKLSAAEGLTACTDTDSEIFKCSGWRLPTEAEWEYAARAGTTTAFHTGDCLSTDEANYDGNHPQTGCAKGEYRRKTIGVCSLAKNAYGLCDMHGNVWEWTMDVYGPYAGLSTQDPLRSSGATERVIRGGSWIIYARNVRSAFRSARAPTDRFSYLGFRLLRP